MTQIERDLYELNYIEELRNFSKRRIVQLYAFKNWSPFQIAERLNIKLAKVHEVLDAYKKNIGEMR